MFTDQDTAIVTATYDYRYVTPSLLSALLGRSPAVIRRRMRVELIRNQYIVPLERARNETHCYCLGPRGFELVADMKGVGVSDLPFSKKVARARTFMLRHTMFVNDIRLAFDLACSAEGSLARMDRTIPEWEMDPSAFRTTSAKGGKPQKPAHHERFVLSERLRSGNTFRSLRPDCGFLMYPKHLRNRLTLMLLEADRSTEDHKRIINKLQAYRLYWDKQLYYERYGARDMRVLFVVDAASTRRRMQRMQRDLLDLAERERAHPDFVRCLRFAMRRQINEDSVLTDPVWFDAWDQARPFVRLQQQNMEMSV